MSKRDARILLQDIMDEIERIERFTASLSFEEFKKNDLVYYATLRCLEIIGEAVKVLPKDLKERYSEVEWRKIPGLRDVIIHGYFGTDPEIIWDVVKRKVPELKIVIEAILDEMEGSK